MASILPAWRAAAVEVGPDGEIPSEPRDAPLRLNTDKTTDCAAVPVAETVFWQGWADWRVK